MSNDDRGADGLKDDATLEFRPRFDDKGLISAIVIDDASGQVLMLGHMNGEALALTRATGNVHFWSRSRRALWMKGESSGHVLQCRAILVDCDQDALLVRAVPLGPTCHTNRPSCFYRLLDDDGLVPCD